MESQKIFFLYCHHRQILPSPGPDSSLFSSRKLTLPAPSYFSVLTASVYSYSLCLEYLGSSFFTFELLPSLWNSAQRTLPAWGLVVAVAELLVVVMCLLEGRSHLLFFPDYYFLKFVYFWLCWVFVAVHGLVSSCVHASHCDNFSCCFTGVLEHGLSSWDTGA